MADAESGRFITFEGGEGVGKSTQIKLLAEALNKVGIKTIVTREPGGSPRAEAIRKLLLSGGAAQFGPAGEAILFSAARIDHIDQKIAPALHAGQWVLCDRFADSTRAYQGAAGNIDPTLIASLERVAVGPIRPDLTFVLDMPVARSLQRVAERRAATAKPDRFEREDRAFHETLRQAFLDIAASEKGRCVVIDADRQPEAIARDLWARVRERFSLLEPGAHAP